MWIWDVVKVVKAKAGRHSASAAGGVNGLPSRR